MGHFGYVNSYEANVPLPVIGSRWVWEIDEPAARSILEVSAVKWNGEEWWVETVALTAGVYSDADTRSWNDVGRFWEACTVVGGALTGQLVIRRPGLAADGVEATLHDAAAV